MKSLLILLHLLLPVIIFCQNNSVNQKIKEKKLIIIGTVLNATNNTPIGFASVYISGTTIGTTAQKDGSFELRTDPEMKNILVASSVGYQSKIIPLGNIKQDTLEVKITMQTIIYNYSQIDVKSEEASKWRKQFKEFKRVFIGEGIFADDCEIQNPYSIDFVEIGDKLLATCDEPLKIVNKALGYKLNCVLSDFELNRETNLFYSVAYIHFIEIVPSTEDSLEQIKNNRLRAYKGSIRHFLTSSIEPAFFRLNNDFVTSYDDSVGSFLNFWVNDPTDIVFKDNKTGNYILNPRDSGKVQYGLDFNSLRIQYYGYGLSDEQRSSRLISKNKKGIKFNKKGFLLSPQDFILLGDMGRKRTSDFLPDNWQPPKHDTSTEIELLKETAKQKNGDRANYELAKIFLNKITLTDLETAKIYSQKAVELNEKNIQYRLLYANILEKISQGNNTYKDDISSIEKEYRKIISLDSSSAEAHSNLGRLLEGDFENYNNCFFKDVGEMQKKIIFHREAEVDAKGWISPAKLEGPTMGSKSSEQQKDTTFSDDVFNSYAMARGVEFKIETLPANPNGEEEPQFFNGMIENIPGTGEIAYRKSSEQVVNTIFQEAEGELLKSISLQPELFDSYFYLAKLYIATNQAAKIIAPLEKYVKTIKDNKDAYMLLGLAYYLDHKNENADNEFNKGFAISSPQELDEIKIAASKLLLEPVTKNNFSKMNNGQIADAIYGYWLMNDPLYLTDYNESFLEHISRTIYSNIFFNINSQTRGGWKTDRGEIALRYGFPTERITLLPQEEVWLYRDKAMGFRANKTDGDYRLSETRSMKIFNAPVLSAKEIHNLKQVKPRIYEPVFEGPTFNLPFNTYQFKSANKGCTDTYIVYSINPADTLAKQSLFSDGFDVGTFFIDDKFNMAFKNRETIPGLEIFGKISYSTDSLMLVGSKMFSVPQSTGGLAFEIIRKKDKGVFTSHRKFDVLSFAGDTLSISKIITCADVTTEGKKESYIHRGNISFLPNPKAAFSSRTKLYLYYEVYNLLLSEQKTTNFKQSLTIRKKEKTGIGGVIEDLGKVLGINSNGKQISLTTNYQTQEKDPQMYLQLDMSKYDPGNYIVTITIEDKVTDRRVSTDSEIIWQ